MAVKLISFKSFGEPTTGTLTMLMNGELVGSVQETGEPFNFPVKRIYYIKDVPPDIRRGGHAHKVTDQVFVCLKGECIFKYREVGYSKEFEDSKFLCLPSGSVGLYCPRLVWHWMYAFQPGTVLLAMASEVHDDKDYLRDYDEFLKEIKGGNL